MNTRSKRLLLLAKKKLSDGEIKPLPEGNHIFLPKYEVTKGLSPEHRQTAIDSSKNIFGDYNETLSEEKTSGSEYIPSSCDSISETDGENQDYLCTNNKLKRNMFLVASNCSENQETCEKTQSSNITSLQKNSLLNKKRKKINQLKSPPITKPKKIKILQNVIVNKSPDHLGANHPDSSINTNKDVEDTDFILNKYFESFNCESQEGLPNNIGQSKVISDNDKPKSDTDKHSLTSSTKFDKNDTKKIERTNREQKECKVETIIKEVNIEEVNSKSNKERKSEESADTGISTETTFRKISDRNEIEIVAAAKRNGKRVRNKHHICYFCNKPIINMARHFKTLHANEAEVAKHLSKGVKDMRQGFREIIRFGDFYHNCNVLATKKGELILIRRPTQLELKLVNDYDYGPCPNCLGFLLKKHIWHHIKYTCNEKIGTQEESQEPKHVIAESNALISEIFGLGFTKEYHDNIIANFKSDNIGAVCRGDILILKFGAMQFEKYGKTQNELIRQNMRQLARLTIALKDASKCPTSSLFDFLFPEKFDLIVQATKDVTANSTVDETSRPQFKIPSLALKLGYALKKCISIQRGASLRAGNLKKNRSLLSLLQLMNLEWNIRISSNALSTLYKRKLNSVQLLPITNDLVKLNNYIDKNITIAKNKLDDGTSPTNQMWTRLANLVLARIILFNKRRSGESAKMRMSDYISRPSWEQQNTQEIQQSLSPIERKLAESLIVVEIEGKRGRKVPVIITPLLKESIDSLIRHRDECKINFHNKYVFARSGQSLGFLRGHDALKKICDELTLENPTPITGTKLRKYVATVCQLFNMTETESDWLARHLGHDIRVHREFYRMHENVVELTKISRLLMAVDQGEASNFAGKQLKDICIQDLPGLEEEDEIEPENEIELVEPEPTTTREIEEDETAKVKTNRKLKQTKKTAPGEKKPWTEEEKSAVLTFFKSNIKKSIIPGKKQCDECIQQNPVLADRPWKNIKYCVKNQIDKIRKIMK